MCAQIILNIGTLTWWQNIVYSVLNLWGLDTNPQYQFPLQRRVSENLGSSGSEQIWRWTELELPKAIAHWYELNTRISRVKTVVCNKRQPHRHWHEQRMEEGSYSQRPLNWWPQNENREMPIKKMIPIQYIKYHV